MTEFEKWYEKNSFFITNKIESEATWLAAFYCVLKMSERTGIDFIGCIKQEIEDMKNE